VNPDVQIPYETNEFHIKTNFLKEIINDSTNIFGKSTKDTASNSIIQLECKEDGILWISIESTNNRIENSIKVPDLKGKFKISFGDRIFSSLVSCLSAEMVGITAKNEFPLKVVEVERIKTLIYMAPRNIEGEIRESDEIKENKEEEE